MKLKKGILYLPIMVLATAVFAKEVLCAEAEHTKAVAGIIPLLLRHSSPDPDGKRKCLADGGQVVTERLPTGDRIYVCEWEKCYTYDDGEFCEKYRCELERYYKGTCYEPIPPIPPPPPDPSDLTVATAFHSKVREILENIENTGYAHNAGHNFSLIPDYTTLATVPPGTKYNLFLDCSGFVGYYVIQGLADKLYKDATPSDYSCQERPLAADFADLIRAAPQVDGDHPAATMDDLSNGEVCWGQIEHVQHIKPGDVIVYKHPQNIGDKIPPDPSDPDSCHREIYDVSGNTGHILFAHGTSKLSDHCKANTSSCGDYADVTFGEWQYVVEVADSTTSQHMYDTRKVNTVDEHGVSIDKSDYYGHKYHAWTAGTYGVVERCEDGSYHRNCSVHGTIAVEPIKIQTNHPDHPTGVGAGKMYISPNRQSYRSNYISSNVCSKKDLHDCSNWKGEIVDGEQLIFIGRPIHCVPLP